MAISPSAKRVLLIDAEAQTRERVAAMLSEAGYHVSIARSPEQAAKLLGKKDHDAVIASAGEETGGPSGQRLAAIFPSLGPVPLLLLCDPPRVEVAIGLLRQGAEDYLLRPPDPFDLRKRLERMLERPELASRVAFFQDELSKKYGFKTVEARSPAMRSLLDRVARVSPMRSTVLIHGESGVGKELVARSIHFNSPRRDHPFIALNCAAIPASLIESELFGHEKGSFTGAHARARGKFEIAHCGTLFLDEIAEMNPPTQAKLLRVLEEKEFMRVGGDQSIRVDVRVIAATNADLEEMVRRAAFRQDLYYRLKVVTLQVPPLRERRPDIPSLVETFLDQLSRANAVRRKSVSPAAMNALRDYAWPGNVRELKNLLEGVLVSVPQDVIDLDDLPSCVTQERSVRRTGDLKPGTTLAEMERELIRCTLEHTGGNRTHSAGLLGIGVRTLQRKIAVYGLAIPPRRRRRRGLAPVG